MASESAGRISLITSFTARPGREDELATTFRRLTDLVRQEKGCLHLTIYQVAEGGRNFVAVETFADEQALGTHRLMPYVKEFSEVLAPQLVESQSAMYCDELLPQAITKLPTDTGV